MPEWLSNRPTSYWQRGCDDARAGRPFRAPPDGVTSYRNGFDFGNRQRLEEHRRTLQAASLHGLALDCGAFRFVQKAPTDPPSYTRFTDYQLAVFVERIRTTYGVDLPDGGQHGR